MKKLLYFLCGIMISGCSEIQEDILDTVLSSEPETNNVELLSTNNLVDDPGNILEKSGFGKKSVEKDNITYIFGEGSDSRGAADTLLYIAPFEGKEGYAIMAAKQIDQEVLAVVDSGTWPPKDNPGIQMFIEQAKIYVQNQHQSYSLKAPARPEFEQTILADEIIEPRVKVAWDQEGFYGSECPNKIVGCVNLAIGQALTYFRVPSEITLTYKANQKLILDWDKIRNHVSWYCHCEEATHLSISQMLRQIGVLTSSTYGADATGATIKAQRNTLISLGLKCSSITKINTAYGLYSTLKNNNCIIFISGKNQNSKGHAWLVSGAKYKAVKNTFYAVLIETGERVINDEVIETKTYLYMNWGFDGIGDGYYLEDVYTHGNDNFDTDLQYYSAYK